MVGAHLKQFTLFMVRITCVVFVTFCTIVAYLAGSLERWDAIAFDKYLSLTLGNTRFADPRIVVVGIDEKDAQRFGSWPLQPKHITQLIEALDYFGVQAIGFHVPLQASGYPEGDLLLERAIANAGNVFLPVDFDSVNVNDGRKIKRSHKRFEKHAKGLGHTHISPDKDGKIRKSKPFIYHGHENYPELGLRLAMDLYNIRPTDLKNQVSKILLPIPNNPTLKIPLTSRGQMLLNWVGPWDKTFIHVSLEDVLEAYKAQRTGQRGPIQTEIFQNTIALIGTTANFQDTIVTPLESGYPKVGVSATVLNSVLEKRFLVAPRDVVNLSVLMVVTFILLLIVSIHSRVYRTLLMISMMLIYLLATLISLVFFNLWLGLAYPFFLILSVYGVITLYHQIVSSVESKKLVGLAMRDQRTGLLNRAHFHRVLGQELRSVFSRRDPHLSLVMVDADHFKKVNDTFGHDAGDEVLKSIAEIIQGSIRSMDVACRYGGEEFLILLPATSKENARRVAEKIRMNIQERKFYLGAHQKPYQVTASFGVAEYKRMEALQAFIERVDKALYTAKSDGRNRVCIS